MPDHSWVLLLAVACAVSCANERDPASQRATSRTRSAVRKAPTPDPRFPTAKSSGSEGVFALEEPDRGPLLTAFAEPSRAGMKGTSHGHCEVDHNTVVCGPKGVGWRVLRSNRHVIAERLRGTEVEWAAFVELGKGGTSKRVVRTTAGVLDWSRHFTRAGTRYSARLRSGANELDGCGAIELELDDRGLAAAATCLQWMGSPMRDKTGVVSVRFERDDAGLVTAMTFVDDKGEPAARHDGVHKVVVERDALGRRTGVSHLDLSERPRRASDDGCAARSLAYDERGLETVRTCLGSDGKPAPDSSGAAVSKLQYDSRGCKVSERYFGLDGAPAKTRFRAHGLSIEVDDACRPIVETCLDADGSPSSCADGEHARVVTKRDSSGYETSRSFFDAQGKPTGDPEYGVFEIRRQRDERGRVEREDCFAAADKPVECDSTGYHSSRDTLDDVGRLRSARYFDEKGQPTTNLGTFEARHTYDNYDHLVEVAYLDEQGKQVTTLGASAQKTLYDEGHRVFAVLMMMGDTPASYEGCFTGRTCPRQPWHAVRVVRAATGEVRSNLFFDANKRYIESIDCRAKRCFGQ